MASRQPSPLDSRPKTNIIFLAITISVSLLIILVFLYLLYRFWYSLVHRSRTSPYDSTESLNKLQRFTYRELKNATNDFSEFNTIGRGGSGTVFRGILKDGKLVAVKLLDSTSLQCEQEFQNELKILGGLKSSFLVCLLGFCVEEEKRLVVYEYMPSKSLQESLFVESDNLCLNWTRRFSIILDVAKALAFLHLECEPAVIHGDVKPSNVLLDAEFRAKLSDFGLSRVKLEGEFGVDLFSQDLGKSRELWKSQEFSENSNAGGLLGENGIHEKEEVDFALALQASSSLKTSGKIHHIDSRGCNMKGKELLSDDNGGEVCDKFMPYDCDFCDMDHSKDLSSYSSIDNVFVSAKQWGKDWWWRQDGSGELCSKDYVNEWIGTQICSSPNPHWDEEMGVSKEQASLDNCKTKSKLEEATGKPVKEHGIEYPNTVTENGERKGTEISQPVCTKKHRTMQDWWKEESLDEIDDKNRDPKKSQAWSKKWLRVPHFDLGKSFHFRRKNKMCKPVNKNMEFSFREGWRKKKARSTGSDMWSGDLFSRELSSTTSMRGTLCYVAPECSGACEYLMEKADIYSLGVLVLVIVSGRRPLHVLNSPMRPEKANLVSWSRLLARSAGSLLELVDERLNGEYNKEQASLCVNLALSCIQKTPELRPDIGDIVKILNGEMELLPLPCELSPSPTSRRRPR